MKLFKLYLIILVIVIAFFGVSRFFPSAYTVRETIIVNKPLNETFAYLSNVRNWEEWSLWNKSIDSTLTFFYNTKIDTAGARQYLYGNLIGKGFIEITQYHHNSSINYFMYLREGDMTANGKFEFTPVNDSQTEIAWIDSGDVGNNPIKRYMIPMVTKSTSDAFQNGLTRIKQQLEAKK
jgi:uncharacterized membrane protein